MIEVLALFAVILGCTGLVVLSAMGANRLDRWLDRRRDDRENR